MCWNFGDWTTVREENSGCVGDDVLIFWKTDVVQRVTVVKLRVYDGGDNCFGCMQVKVEHFRHIYLTV